MKKLLKKYPVISVLTAVCLLFAVAASLNEGTYDLFAFHSKPLYFWQYFSGTFMHGSKGAPKWFTWVHLFMNYLMIIPFGGLVEAKKGTKYALTVFIVSMLISSVTFQILLYGQDELACGISAVGYAFVAGGVLLIINSWKTYSVKRRVLYVILCCIAAIMLLPVITGWISTCLHLSGIIGFCIAHLLMKLSERFSEKS